MRESRDESVKKSMSDQPIGKHIDLRFNNSNAKDIENTINQHYNEGSSEKGLDKEKGPWQTQILQSAFLSLSAGALAYIVTQNSYCRSRY